MSIKRVSLPAEFNKNLTRAVLSIILFVLVYLVLLLTGGLITVLTILLGVFIIAIHPSFITIMLGLGALGMGVVIFIFLIKFIFKRNVVDRSHLIEIKAKDEPQLFAILQEIVDEVQTQFPKKVYLSSVVNASVFYNSSFWSMFFPVRKNLEIGLGLVNGMNQSELKAILAHEFGHFSQGSMKVGSYVYQVNQIIYNLLNENESFNRGIERWANVSAYFAIFVNLAVRIIWGMQWILQKVYNIVNLNYMGLSREMEFHADAVAAHVSGSKPMITGLSRIGFVDKSFQEVLSYYGSKIEEGLKTQNVYPPHRLTLQLLASMNKYPLHNGLPEINAENQLNQQSKFNIKDQWASHPSTPDRVEALKKLDIDKGEDDRQPADEIFTQLPRWQTALTQQMFANVTYKTPPQDQDLSDFQADYKSELEKGAFPELYNGYYDQYNPVAFELSELEQASGDAPLVAFDMLFDNTKTERMFEKLSLENDLNWLDLIQKGEYKVKTFDYAGVKYSDSEASGLLDRLKVELERINSQIKAHDLAIFLYFHKLAKAQGKEALLLDHYQKLIDFDRAYEQRQQLYIEMRQGTEFMSVQTPYEEIEANLQNLKQVELRFKPMIQLMLEEPIYQAAVTSNLRLQFEQYCAQEWVYFTSPAYNEEALGVLFETIHRYIEVLRATYFNLKKELLVFQDQLLENNEKKNQ